MANMSYCRFRNTLLAFQDCSSVVEDLIESEGSADEALDGEELSAAKQLITAASNLLFELSLALDCEDVTDVADESEASRLHNLLTGKPLDA